MSKASRQLTRMYLAVRHSQKAKKIAETGATVAALTLLGVGLAYAGTDTTFAATTTNLTNWTTGSLGKLAAVGAVAFGVVGAVARFDWKLIAGGVGIGLAASTGPGIVSGIMSATF